jgi:hypothetical protein
MIAFEAHIIRMKRSENTCKGKEQLRNYDVICCVNNAIANKVIARPTSPVGILQIDSNSPLHGYYVPVTPTKWSQVPHG